MQLAFFLQLGEGFFHILDESGLHVRIVVSRKYLFRGKCGDPLDRGQIGGRIGGKCRIKRPAFYESSGGKKYYGRKVL